MNSDSAKTMISVQAVKTLESRDLGRLGMHSLVRADRKCCGGCKGNPERQSTMQHRHSKQC